MQPRASRRRSNAYEIPNSADATRPASSWRRRSPPCRRRPFRVRCEPTAPSRAPLPAAPPGSCARHPPPDAAIARNRCASDAKSGRSPGAGSGRPTRPAQDASSPDHRSASTCPNGKPHSALGPHERRRRRLAGMQGRAFTWAISARPARGRPPVSATSAAELPVRREPSSSPAAGRSRSLPGIRLAAGTGSANAMRPSWRHPYSV